MYYDVIWFWTSKMPLVLKDDIYSWWTSSFFGATRFWWNMALTLTHFIDGWKSSQFRLSQNLQFRAESSQWYRKTHKFLIATPRWWVFKWIFDVQLSLDKDSSVVRATRYHPVIFISCSLDDTFSPQKTVVPIFVDFSCWSWIDFEKNVFQVPAPELLFSWIYR